MNNKLDKQRIEMRIPNRVGLNFLVMNIIMIYGFMDGQWINLQERELLFLVKPVKTLENMILTRRQICHLATVALIMNVKF